MDKRPNDIVFFHRLRRLFSKKKLVVLKDDIGIFHDIASYGTANSIANDLKYDYYAKIKAVEIYEDLVEVDIINIKITDSVSQDIVNLITNNFPRYIEPSKIKWKIKDN